MRLLSRLQVLILVTLIGMIFVRLVWMNLRVYSVRLDPRVAETVTLVDRYFKKCVIRDDLLARQPGEIDLGQSVPKSWQRSWIYMQYVKLSCDKGKFSVDRYVKHNQMLLVVMITFCVFITRLFCRSWLFCLVVAAVLLSRGRLLSEIENISGLGLTTTLFTIWMFTMFHWIKTASPIMYGVSWLVLLALIELESSLVFVLFTIPLLLSLLAVFRVNITWSVMRRMNGEWKKLRNNFSFSRKRAQESDQYEGVPIDNPPMPSVSVKESEQWLLLLEGIFRPLQIPFTLWILTAKRLIGYRNYHFFISTIVALIFLVSQALVNGIQIDHQFELVRWIFLAFETVDLDLSIATLIVILGLFAKPPGGVLNYWESLWFFATTAFLVTLSSLGWDLFFNNGSGGFLWKAPNLALWLEPVTLCVGLVGIYNFGYMVNKKIFG